MSGYEYLQTGVLALPVVGRWYETSQWGALGQPTVQTDGRPPRITPQPGVVGSVVTGIAADAAVVRETVGAAIGNAAGTVGAAVGGVAGTVAKKTVTVAIVSILLIGVGIYVIRKVGEGK